MLLLVGDDWAEDHHDVEVQDETGRRLGKARMPEGIGPELRSRAAATRTKVLLIRRPAGASSAGDSGVTLS